jgi:type I restriction enzyme S subunit
MKFSPYTRYKPSRVDWAGDLPAHWDALPLKRRHRIVNGGTPSSTTESYWDGDINWITPEDLGRNQGKWIGSSRRTLSLEGLANSGAQLVPCDSLVVSTRAPIGHVAILAKESCTNQGCRALTPYTSEAYSGFIYYALLASRPVIQAAGKGTTFLELSAGLLGLHTVPFPPTEEQRVIAEFLDRETGKIDKIVAKKLTLIERLKDKRIALISRTVTRGLPAGLNSNSELKPSGIEWLGDVPKHWMPKRLRFISPHITVGIVVEPSKYYEEQGIPCLRSLNVRPNALLDRDLVFISAESHRILSKSMLRKGDLVAVRSGQPGTTAVVDDRFDGANCIDLIIIRKPKTGNPTFISYFLNSLPAQAQFSGGSGGAIQQHFNIGTAADLWLMEPPPAEQDAIADFLDRETTKIDRMIRKIEGAIDRLREYRIALITAAVTGKIDVRSVRA